MPHNLIVISDSANNRVIIVREDTLECVHVVGNGKIGLVDGSF